MDYPLMSLGAIAVVGGAIDIYLGRRNRKVMRDFYNRTGRDLISRTKEVTKRFDEEISRILRNPKLKSKFETILGETN